MKTSVQIPANAKPGDTVEIEVPGVVAEADLSSKYTPNEAITRIVQDRLTQFGRGHVKLEDITAKPEVKQQVMDLLGIKAQGGDGSDVGKQLEGARRQWDETVLKPVAEQAQISKTEIESLRRDRLTDSIVAAGAQAGVMATLLNPPFPGAKPPLVAMLEQGFAFEEKTRQWYARGANADQPYAFAAQPSGAQPYKAVEEAVRDWAKKPENKQFVGITTQSGPGANTGGGSSIGGGVLISHADAKNPQKWARAREEARKQGVDVQYSD
jgi:hypothetical protein